jgi:hypothetical protein
MVVFGQPRLSTAHEDAIQGGPSHTPKLLFATNVEISGIIPRYQ